MGQLSTTIGITGVASVVYGYGDTIHGASKHLFRIMSVCVLGYGMGIGILATMQCQMLLRASNNRGLPREYYESVSLWPVFGYVYIGFLGTFFTIFIVFRALVPAKRYLQQHAHAENEDEDNTVVTIENTVQEAPREI